MPVYTPGGGGGPARPFDENDGDALSKPYDVSWPMNADQLQQINEMFDMLFKSMVKRKNEITTLESAPVASSALLTRTVNISNTQLQGMNTTPVEIIPAQGAGTVIYPVHFARTIVTTVAASGNPSANFTYNLFNSATITGSASGKLFELGTHITWVLPSASNELTTGTFDVRNKSVKAALSADTSGGTATMQVDVAYYVVSGV